MKFSRIIFGALLSATLATLALAPAPQASPAISSAAYSATCNIAGSVGYSIYYGVTAWTIAPGGYFSKGEYCQIGKSKLTMQSDGNLVLYDENNHARWASNTQGSGNTAIFQIDMNFVVYDAAGRARWASNTCCNSSAYTKLAVQSDGNVVIYDQNLIPHWATNTTH